MLNKDNCCFSGRHKKITSRDNGCTRCHIGHNRNSRKIYQYKLDTEVFPNQKCCDFLLLNSEDSKAYLIEIKGADLDHASEQLAQTLVLLDKDLVDYEVNLRIVASKVKTQAIMTSTFKKFQKKYGKRLVFKSQIIEESIS